MAEEKKEEGAEEEGGGGKKKLILLIVGAIALVGIAVGATLFLMGGGEPAEGEATEEVVEEKQPKGEPVYVEIKPAFTVNLDPNDPVGFLQVSIQILTFYDDVAEELNTHMPLIKNNLFTLFGEQKSADLRSPEGKETLQKAVHQTIQDVIDKYGSGGEVDSAFFTTFVMQ